MMDTLSFADCNGHAIEALAGHGDPLYPAGTPAAEVAGESGERFQATAVPTQSVTEAQPLATDHGWCPQMTGHVLIPNGHKVRIFNGPLPHPPEPAG